MDTSAKDFKYRKGVCILINAPLSNKRSLPPFMGTKVAKYHLERLQNSKVFAYICTHFVQRISFLGLVICGTSGAFIRINTVGCSYG